MTRLLDTDTCIGVLRQRPGMVRRLSQVAPTDCAVSIVTVYELFCGLAKAQDRWKRDHEDYWRIKDELSAARGHSIDRLFAEARKCQKHSGHRVVNLQGQRKKR